MLLQNSYPLVELLYIIPKITLYNMASVLGLIYRRLALIKANKEALLKLLLYNG